MEKVFISTSTYIFYIFINVNIPNINVIISHDLIFACINTSSGFANSLVAFRQLH